MVTEEEVKAFNKAKELLDSKTPSEILVNRIKAEEQRQQQKEIDFWNEVGKHVKIHTDISEVDKFEPSPDAQILEKFSDLKINFKRG